jgi:ribose/xylose/arabinose/galactoside ABC-type transport system permease subunit
MMTIILGGGKYISEFPRSYTIFGKSEILGVPSPVLILFLSYIFFTVLLSTRSFGRQLYSVGINKVAARVSGVNDVQIKITAFIISGTLSAFAGLIQTTRFIKVDSSIGEGIIFYVVAAAVIGGISINGGKGNMIGALGGVFFVAIISNLLAWFRLQPTIVDSIKGGLILFAVILDAIKNKAREYMK